MQCWLVDYHILDIVVIHGYILYYVFMMYGTYSTYMYILYFILVIQKINTKASTHIIV